MKVESLHEVAIFVACSQSKVSQRLHRQIPYVRIGTNLAHITAMRCLITDVGSAFEGRHGPANLPC